MENNAVIQVNGVSKKFCRSLKRSMWYGFRDILRDTAGLRPKSGRLRRKEFWAVDDVSFELKKGEALGLIGPNGAGKTTLLKMLNGIIIPDKGNLRIKGRVGALIQVGAGFHPQLTGRENIYINGAILGMGKREIERKFDAIVEFADIGDFLNTPVKFYSSGMFVRLGFAVAAHCEPDILLVDEILAVGDISFQSKCLDHISKLRTEGVATVLVSHHMPKIGSACDRVMFLLHGKTKLLDKTHIVINEFENHMYKGMNHIQANSACLGYVTLGGAKIQNVKYEQKCDGEIRIKYGQPIRLSFDYDLEDKDIRDCAVAILVKRVSDGIMCFGALSNFNGFKFTRKKGHMKISVEEHNLVPGLYNIDVQIRTISHDNAYVAYREPKLIVDYPEDKYILKNLAGVFQPNKIVWKMNG